MTDDAPAKAKKPPMKKPKIIQVFTHMHGSYGVLYDNGRVFLWNFTKLPNYAESGEGYWGELKYPEL